MGKTNVSVCTKSYLMYQVPEKVSLSFYPLSLSHSKHVAKKNAYENAPCGLFVARSANGMPPPKRLNMYY